MRPLIKAPQPPEGGVAIQAPTSATPPLGGRGAPLILFSILLAAVSCHFSRQVATESVAATSADSVTASSVDSSSLDIVSIRSDFEIDLSGISISYSSKCDREEARPRAVQSPRSIHIASASIKSSSQASSIKSTQSAATDSTAVSSVARSGQRSQSAAEVNKHTASSAALKFLIPAIIILFLFITIRKIRAPA